jgi:N6-L-threonylcarbamoyladenine synthase
MLVLGIETSCDETSAAIVRDGTTLLSNIVASQIPLHERYGGVVPELASRRHVETIVPVVRDAFEKAGAAHDDLDGIAVTNGPGLIGSLLVGLCWAKAFAFVRRLPLVGVNHLEGHLAAIHLEGEAPPFPHVALLVSGGHTSLFRVDRFGGYAALGSTRDDAAGEAFDKVAKMLGLGYPGGAVIERLAAEGNPEAIRFPRPHLRSSDLQFSFSGLKTAVANHLARVGRALEAREIRDVCAAFQAAVVEVLIEKTARAARESGVETVLVAGGVAANTALREAMGRKMAETGGRVLCPSRSLCTDNAAMIAAAGFRRLAAGERAGLDLNAYSRMPLEGSLSGKQA